MQTAFKIFCGLGNPSTVAPADSLHNLGFMAVDQYALDSLKVPAWEKLDEAEICILAGLVLVKPLFEDINSSGVAVRRVLDSLQMEPKDLVVIHDDIDLAPGKVKVAQSDNNPRHNGIKSIKQELSSSDFVQLKGGIGRPSDRSISILSWVKDKMADSMKPIVEKLVIKLASALDNLRSEGLASTQSKFNL